MILYKDPNHTVITSVSSQNIKNKSLPSMAEEADKFDCYQKSVQEPEHEIEVFDIAFREAYGKKPISLREDFCGTFAVSCEWVKSHKNRWGIAVDICPDTLQWGIHNNQSKLKPETLKRIEVLNQDVRSSSKRLVDVLAAQNFSFWIFKTRKEVVDYFKIILMNLDEQGIVVLDMMGGKECYATDTTEKRTVVKGHKGFKYHWEQAYFNPITGDCSFYIHFKFADGSKMKKAFEYHWRFWTIPEVKEMLAEAGFRKSLVYWDIAPEDEEAEWKAVNKAPNDDSWLCYIVGVK